MLDSLKRLGARASSSPSAEIAAQLAEVRQERERLTALLAEVSGRSAELEKVSQAAKRLDGVDARLASVEKTAASVAAVSADVGRLQLALQEARQGTEKLLGADGEWQAQRQLAQQLSAQSLQARATLDTLLEEREAFDALRKDIVQARAEITAARAEAASVTSDVAGAKLTAEQTMKGQEQLRGLARDAQDAASASAALVREITQKMSGLSTLQEAARTVEERLGAQNALAEHVAQKSKVLEAQKHTVEQAIVDAHKLTEMVQSMNAKVARLEEGTRQATRAEETVDRVERLVQHAAEQLEVAGRARDTLAADLARLERDRSSLVEFVRRNEERLAGDRRDLDVCESRLSSVQEAIAIVERAQAAFLAREKDASNLAGRLDVLGARVEAQEAAADEAGKKVAAVETLRLDLMRVDEMARRTVWQMESLKGARQDLEELRADIQAFYGEHAEAAQLRDRLSADRATLEAFLERATAFAANLPELDARMNAIRGNLASVDEGTAKAANMVAIADDLDRHMTRLSGYQQFVERIEGRLNALHSMTADVDRRIDDQIARRAEIDALRSLCEGVDFQAGEVRQKLEGISQAQAKLLPVAAEIASLKIDVDRSAARLASMKRDDGELTVQEKRLAGMLGSVRDLAGETAERLVQVQGLVQSLDRSTALKDALVDELAVVQGRQRDVAGQLQAAEAQMQHLDGLFRQIEERRDRVAFTEKRVVAVDGRLTELQALADAVEARIATLGAERHTLDALRQQVDGVHEAAARSRADLDHVEAKRGEVVSLRARMDELLATSRATDERLADIQSRRRVVDEVQLKVNVITTMLDDVRVNLETVGAQRTVIDHAMAHLARLDEGVQQAQITLRALQTERELAERIEKGIQTLRARTAPTEDRKRA